MKEKIKNILGFSAIGIFIFFGLIFIASQINWFLENCVIVVNKDEIMEKKEKESELKKIKEEMELGFSQIEAGEITEEDLLESIWSKVKDI